MMCNNLFQFHLKIKSFSWHYCTHFILYNFKIQLNKVMMYVYGVALGGITYLSYLLSFRVLFFVFFLFMLSICKGYILFYTYRKVSESNRRRQYFRFIFVNNKRILWVVKAKNSTTENVKDTDKAAILWKELSSSLQFSSHIGRQPLPTFSKQSAIWPHFV